MSAGASPWGAIAQGASSAFGSHLNYMQGEQNRDQAARFMKKRYQYMVHDLKKAGLNPMLAVGGASPGSASPSNSIGNVDLSGVGEAISTAYQIKKMKADIDLANEQAETEDTKQGVNKAQKESIETNTTYKKPGAELIDGANLSNTARDLGETIQNPFKKVGSFLGETAAKVKLRHDEQIYKEKQKRKSKSKAKKKNSKTKPSERKFAPMSSL